MRKSIQFALLWPVMTVLASLVPLATPLWAAPVIRLNWSAVSVSPAATNYKVYRGTSSGGESLLTTLGVVTTYDDAAATPGTTYYYFVTAVNSNGEGPASNETHQVIPAGSVTLTPPTLTFPSGGGIQDATVTNGTASTITFTSFGTTGGFTQTHTCGTTLGAGLTCVIHVTPPGIGASGILTEIDNTGTHTTTLNQLAAPTGSSLVGVWNITP